MIPLAQSLDVGRFTTGVRDSFMVPRIKRVRRPYMYLHGAGGNADEMYGAFGVPEISPLLMGIINERKASLSCPTLTSTWGNATTITRMNQALAYQRAQLGATTDPPVLICASHGATCALTYAATNPVAAIVGMIPCIDLQNMRVNDVFSLRGNIDSAMGVTYPAPLPAGKNPYTTTISPPVPSKFWYSSDDAVSANIVPYAAARPSVELHNVGALGHSNAALAAVDLEEVLEFLKLHVSR